METNTNIRTKDWVDVLIIIIYIIVWFWLFSNNQAHVAWDFSPMLLILVDPIVGTLLSVIPSRPFTQLATGALLLVLSITFPERILWRWGNLMPVFNVVLPFLVMLPVLIGIYRVLKLKNIIK